MYLYMMAAVFGSVVGSFLNVCIYRIPREENIAFPASHCPECEKPIRRRHNIPVLGWLMLGGKCADCGEKIPVTYPVVEFLTALLALWIVSAFGITWEALALFVLGCSFLVLSGIDFFYYILPNVITYPGAILGVILAALPGLGTPFPTLEDSLWGLGIGGGGLFAFAWLFAKLTGKDGMGMGDVKLLGMIGAWLGWQALPFTIFGAAVMGSVVGIGWIVIAGRDRNLPIPFGPYLAVTAWLYIFYGQQTYDWYLSTL